MILNLPAAQDEGFVIFSSFGNDSIALIQWAYEKGLKDVVIVHSNTGWAAPWWEDRVKKAMEWAEGLGMLSISLPSEGMEALVRRKKAWPRQGMQFCSMELKIRPAQEFLNILDPECEATCLVGIRREESRARSQWPGWIEESENHGGRSLWSPLVTYTDAQRDELLERAGWPVLPHRSMECFPCINSNRNDLKLLTPERVEELAQIEESMGITSKGKPRTIFRPYRHMGAIGVREVYRWAHSKRGAYKAPVHLAGGSGCDSGMCPA